MKRKQMAERFWIPTRRADEGVPSAVRRGGATKAEVERTRQVMRFIPVMAPVTRFFFLLLLSSTAGGATLPGMLRPQEINRIVEIIGVGAASRLMRSAEAYPSWPGIKAGLEVPLIFARDLDDLGDGTGSLPGLNPTPRFYLAKGLFWKLDIVLNWFPSSVFNSVSTLGGMLKWTFYEEKESWLTTAFYLGITHIDAYGGAYIGNDQELGALISKDYVRVRPYAGLGLLFAQGSVNRALVTGTENSGSLATIHTFAGIEIEMPVQFTFQADLFNLSFGASLFVGKHFF